MVEMTAMAVTIALRSLSCLSMRLSSPYPLQRGTWFKFYSRYSGYRMIPSLWVERLERFRCPEGIATSGAKEAKAARCPKARPPGLERAKQEVK